MLRAPIRQPSPGQDARSGFTFIEVIVTAVIVGILAAAAIPVYTSYVNAQRTDTLKNLAQMTAAAANIYARRANASPACASTAACVTMLGIFVSDPAEFAITIVGNTVTVLDNYHPSIAAQTATF